MSYINKDTLIAFYQKESWLTKDNDVDGRDELIGQIDSIIFSKTKVPIPAGAEICKSGELRNNACKLFVYLASGKQGKLEQDERLRRKELNTEAMAYLNDVKTGKEKVYDDDTELVLSTSEKPEAVFTSTKRVTML